MTNYTINENFDLNENFLIQKIIFLLHKKSECKMFKKIMSLVLLIRQTDDFNQFGI